MSTKQIMAELRANAVKLIEIIRSIPADERTPAMEKMLFDLSRAVDEYDRQAGTT